MRSRSLGASLALVAILVTAAPASASTTVGQVASAVVPSACANGTAYTLVDPSAKVPAPGGVITKFETAFAGPQGAAFSYRVFRAGATVGTYRGVGTAAATVAADGTATVSARIPVQAGDMLAISRPSTAAGSLGCVVPAPSATLVGAAVEAADGVDTPLSGVGAYVVNARATIEPDADADGYGDETQDACPNSPQFAAPCNVDLRTTAQLAGDQPRAGGVATVVFSVTSAGAPAAGAKLDVSTGGTVLSLVGDGCSGSSCALGTIATGATRQIVAVVRVPAGGWTVTGSASSSGAETAPADNAASVSGTAEEAATITQSAFNAAVTQATSSARCRVPKLKGMTLSVATVVLKATGCKLGKVTGAKSGRRVVRSQGVTSGTVLPAGAAVSVKLKAAK